MDFLKSRKYFALDRFRKIWHDSHRFFTSTIIHKQTLQMTSIAKSGLIVSLWLFLLAFSGCGKTPVVENPAEQPQTSQKEITAAVEKFLGAVRSGNDEEIFNMFSPQARGVFSRNQLPSLPANDSAQFRIDLVHLVNDNEAQVRTTMIDLDETGQKVEDSIAWALRKTDAGWRIAGMACVFVEGMEPVVVNFESREAIAEAEAQVEAQAKAMTARFQELQENSAIRR